MHCEESSFADLGLDEEDMAGVSQNVGYLKWRWNNQFAVPTPGLELGIDIRGADQGPKSQFSYTPSAWGLPGTVITVPSGRQERIQHKIKCLSISERQSQDTPRTGSGISSELRRQRQRQRQDWNTK